MVVAEPTGQVRVHEQTVDLPTERFAGAGAGAGAGQPPAPAGFTDWNAADQEEQARRIVSYTPNGELVISDPSEAPAESVELPNEGFAASTPEIGSWRDTTLPDP